MKEFDIPETITLRDRWTGTIGSSFSFLHYAYEHWFNDDRWNKGKNSARLAIILPIFDKCAATTPDDAGVPQPKRGARIRMEDSDHALLVEVIGAPTVAKQKPLVQIQLDGYPNAVLNAKTIDLSQQ